MQTWWKTRAIGKTKILDMKRILRRLLLMPLGLVKGIIDMANEKARDIDNKLIFKKVIVGSGCSFTADVTVGAHARILSNCTINHSHIGSYTYINRDALIQHATIGNYCSIAQDVVIGLGKHPLHLFATSPLFYRAKNPLNIQLIAHDLPFDEYEHITIGSDVWIGARATIMHGINIGHGAVIAASAVVSKDVPPYAVVGGVPAKVIKYRFPEHVIAQLLDQKWWDLPAEQVHKKRSVLEDICQ